MLPTSLIQGVGCVDSCVIIWKWAEEERKLRRCKLVCLITKPSELFTVRLLIQDK